MKDFALNTIISVDLDEVEEFVTSEKFTDFLLSNTTDFSVAAFVLQILLDEIKKVKEEEK